MRSFAFGAIDLAVGTDDEAVEVIDQFRIARLGTCDRKVGGGPSVKLAKLADLHTRETAKARALHHAEQVLKPTPVVFFVFEEDIHDSNTDCRWQD
jgi:hypothetical protein